MPCRTGTLGVESFDATYGAGFQAADDSPHAVECELVEDGGAFGAHRPTDADRPRRAAFVDARLTALTPAARTVLGWSARQPHGTLSEEGPEM